MDQTIFAIGRQYGSAGHKIGEQLAGYLDIPFYDTAWAAHTAAEYGAEGKEPACGGSLDPLPIKGRAPLGTQEEVVRTEDARLLRLRANLVQTAAARGACVFVGCCAESILRENPHLFSVFVYADQFTRMDRIVNEYETDPAQAAESLIRKDRLRAAHYYFFSGKKWDDPENYHLTLDSSTVSIDDAVRLICSAARKREPAAGLHAPEPAWAPLWAQRA